MSANGVTPRESFRAPQLGGLAGLRAAEQHQPKEEGAEDDSCAAFGYLRGTRDKALALEFRFRNGNAEWFPYSLLGGWRYNPSVGLLLKFTGDLVSLVLIRGSNLDAAVTQDGAMNLTTHGLQRHRVVWIREMDEEAVRRTGEAGPTIDSIDVAEFDSHAEMQEWLGKMGPEFVR